MAVYSIKDLENISGIKAHTIRMWEQRYSLLEPKRTDTNIRYYLDDDLRHLLNVVFLKNNGMKISHIASLGADGITKKVKELSIDELAQETRIEGLTIAMMEMDEFKFDQIISLNIREHGFEQTMLQIIHPFLDKLGALWLTGSIHPVQESFISNLIRQKLVVAIDSLSVVSGTSSKKFMLYLPEGEMQELSVLFMHYLLKARNFRVVYLGQEISIEDVTMAYEIHRPDYVFTILTESPKKDTVEGYVYKVTQLMRDTHFLFTGYQIVSNIIEMPSNGEIVTGLNDTLKFISSL